MPTFLTNKKMDPELAARIEASIREGRTPGRGRATTPRLVATLRFAAVIAIAALASALYLMQRQATLELEQRRDALLAAVRKESADLTAAERRMTSRVLELLDELAGPYPGDEITDAVRGSRALSETLDRPIVYVRGPIGDFSSPVRVAESAARSFRDPFVLCLLDPPEERTERALLARAHLTYTASERRSRTENVERLHDALLGLPYLSPAWEKQVRQAETRVGLAALKTGFHEAPIEGAKRAAQAELLLTVLDEPNDGSGPTELDGACPHYARVELVELSTGRVLLRLRKHVDPEWISPQVRVQHASGINACELALDVREHVAAPVATADQREAL